MTMQTIRAVRMHAYGDADVLRLDDVERSALGPRDVRIAVHASAINLVDAKIRSGGQRAIIPLRLPWALGMDGHHR